MDFYHNTDIFNDTIYIFVMDFYFGLPNEHGFFIITRVTVISLFHHILSSWNLDFISHLSDQLKIKFETMNEGLKYYDIILFNC